MTSGSLTNPDRYLMRLIPADGSGSTAFTYTLPSYPIDLHATQYTLDFSAPGGTATGDVTFSW